MGVALLMLVIVIVVFAIAIGIIYLAMSWGLRQGIKDDADQERNKDR
jgi:hypothetical protein